MLLNFNFHHVSINVCNIVESKNFYHLLGFNEFYKYSSEKGDVCIVHLLNNGVILELFWYSVALGCKLNGPELKHQDFIGIDHFSLQTDNLEEAFNTLTKYTFDDTGIQNGRTGIRYFFIIDPDGNRIEIVEDTRRKNEI